MKELEGLPRPWIVDVGGGNDPLSFSNIIVDKYPGETIHRRLRKIVRDGQNLSMPLVIGNRRFIEADVEALPFLDKSIDYIYCSHVLEHVEHPLTALSELNRVGISGTVVLPHIRQEVLFKVAWGDKLQSHKWVCWRDSATLVFMRYDTLDPEEVGRLVEHMHLDRVNAIDAYVEVRMHWGPEADRFKHGLHAVIVEIDPDDNPEELTAALPPTEGTAVWDLSGFGAEGKDIVISPQYLDEGVGGEE